MAVAWVECWKCELCGHRWIRTPGTPPPRQCSKCKRVGWHTVETSSDEQNSPDFTPVSDNAGRPDIAALRAICAGHTTPEPDAGEATERMCTYTEYDTDTGETHRCSLPEHSPKRSHSMGIRVE